MSHINVTIKRPANTAWACEEGQEGAACLNLAESFEARITSPPAAKVSAKIGDGPASRWMGRAGRCATN